RGWPHSRLARELGVDRTTLTRVRSGRNPISQPLLVRIGMAFGGSPAIQTLMLHYLLIEAPRRIAQQRKGATAPVFVAVPYSVRWRIRRWLAQVGGTDAPQRGLFLTGPNVSLLSAAARFAVDEAKQQGRTHLLLRASDRLTETHAKSAMEVDVLVIERVDFASESVTRLIHARSDALRPMILTSAGGRDGFSDPHLVRVLRAWTETITVSGTRAPTARRHAAQR